LFIFVARPLAGRPSSQRAGNKNEQSRVQNNEKIKKYSCINFRKVFLSRIERLDMGLMISQKPK
jgi:hypothetical protein